MVAATFKRNPAMTYRSVMQLVAQGDNTSFGRLLSALSRLRSTPEDAETAKFAACNSPKTPRSPPTSSDYLASEGGSAAFSIPATRRSQSSIRLDASPSPEKRCRPSSHDLSSCATGQYRSRPSKSVTFEAVVYVQEIPRVGRNRKLVVDRHSSAAS
ncbi:hypothetical protein T484DRAFT_1753484 [Baffinella frigidus]|nr:hypothetical protein T484DRAFT_1753484 [Cryptophyta sp. CCMP2293]